MTYRLAALAVVFCTSSAFAQPTVSRALEPAASDLDRLNLTVAWRAVLAITDHGDGISSVQSVDDQVIVQLKSGQVTAFQADTSR